MGALLFIAGDKREMLPHARIMIHDPLIAGGVSGSALKIADISRELMETREITGNIIAKHTGKSLEEVYPKTASDAWFDAQEAVTFGLADRIIDKI